MKRFLGPRHYSDDESEEGSAIAERIEPKAMTVVARPATRARGDPHLTTPIALNSLRGRVKVRIEW